MVENKLLTNIHPFTGCDQDYQFIAAKMQQAKIVLLGEATHGTHEFYQIRAELTKQLIEKEGFNAIAIEADWPDTYKINDYCVNDKGTAESCLEGFKRFPTWMWRNHDMLKFVKWLHDYNTALPHVGEKHEVGIYGLDLYSLHTSIAVILRTLERLDPAAALRARRRYSCLDRYGENPQDYAYAVGLGLSKGCAEEVWNELQELQTSFFAEWEQRSPETRENFFNVLQNAKTVKGAEAYYRSLVGGDISSWNLRDQHMMDTLESLRDYYDALLDEPCKIVVWAHNSHVGDARATHQGERGEFNIGQLVKAKHGALSYALGFSTAVGTVTAASDWGGSAECKNIRPPLKDSYELLFSEANYPAFFLLLGAAAETSEAPPLTSKLHRAIGVIYKPETERQSHYFYSILSKQYDGIIHINETHAVRPLDIAEKWLENEMPEAFPSGL